MDQPTENLDIPDEPYIYERICGTPGVHVFRTHLPADPLGMRGLHDWLRGKGAVFGPEGPMYMGGMFTRAVDAIQRDADIPIEHKSQIDDFMRFLDSEPSVDELRKHACIKRGVVLRMMVFELAEKELVVVTPIFLRKSLKIDLDALGKVKYIVCTGAFHHCFLSDYMDAFPEAMLIAPPDLAARRPELKVSIAVNEPDQENLAELRSKGIEICPISLGPMLELGVFHRASGVLAGGDLVNVSGMNRPPEDALMAPAIWDAAAGESYPKYARGWALVWSYAFSILPGRKIESLLGHRCLPSYRVLQLSASDPQRVRKQLQFIQSLGVRVLLVSHHDTAPLGAEGVKLLEASYGWVDGPQRDAVITACMTAY
eukprot:TRINITY_DN12304_c0_g1_i1.p1 TRINITY_DN12304_c0_g1~~TRINITY_DN12304_c0_g1_i1.p1  ORF type:complete len:385 (-),score=41.01 TRINITY_DN12304_c0_g1_i1:362-1474(-)